MIAIFLLNLAWVCPCSPPVPSLSIPLRGENKGMVPWTTKGSTWTTKEIWYMIVHKHPKLSTKEALVVHGIIPMGETSKGF